MPCQIAPPIALLIRLATLVAVLLGVVGAAGAHAQESPAVEWQMASLTGKVRRLYTPTSGVLFARTEAGLMRSDDAGQSWREVLLALNASGRNEPAPPPLQLSLDDGHTWIGAMPDGLGKVNDVAFGIDGKLMFAATETGLWRATAP